MFLSGSPVRALDNNTNDKNYIIPMEKKMYNQPATEILEIGAWCVMESLSGNGGIDPGNNTTPDAPARYPQF